MACNATARMLLLFAGAMRSYEHAYPMLRAQLRLDELASARALETDVVVLTSLRVGCTQKDVQLGVCVRPARETSGASVRRRMRGVYGHRLRFIMDMPDIYGKGVAVIRSAVDTRAAIFLNWLAHACEPSAPGLGRAALQRSGSPSALRAYAVVLVLRPDIYLVAYAPQRPRTFAPLNPLELCARHPGASLLSGSLYRVARFHHRDWDHGMLICPPARLEDWLLLDRKPDDSCVDTAGCKLDPPVPPERPEHITGNWSGGQHAEWAVCRTVPWLRFLCDRALYFRNRRVPFDALPDAVALTHILRLRRAPLGTGFEPCTHLSLIHI